MKIMMIALLILIIAGCSQARDFSYGIDQVNKVNSGHNISFDYYTGDEDKLDAIGNSYRELKDTKLNSDQDAFSGFMDYLILDLESKKNFVKSLRYGDVGTTKMGFACKSRPFILETAAFKNQSAIDGFNSMTKLKGFIDSYPKQAGMLNLSQKDIVFRNATYYQLAEDAEVDSGVINEFCPENITLEAYKMYFRKETDLSDEYINNLDYNTAVSLYKKDVGAD